MLRQNRFTKAIRRLLHGGEVAVRKHSQSRVLPSAQLAYETCLSAASIAMLADGHLGHTASKRWRPTRSHPNVECKMKSEECRTDILHSNSAFCIQIRWACYSP